MAKRLKMPGVIRGQCVRQLAKFVSKNIFQKSSLKRDGPVFFSSAPVKVVGDERQLMVESLELRAEGAIFPGVCHGDHLQVVEGDKLDKLGVLRKV